MRSLALLAVVGLARAAVREHTWNITYVDGVDPTGLQPRRVIGVNGTWPPPILVGQDGDLVRLTAINGLGDVGTALHSHGNFFANGYAMYDGASSVTQCAIPPGKSLTYEIPFAQGPGTYWIHGHYNGQYVDGLRSPYIIQQANESAVYGYDEEYTVIMGDWYHDEHPQLMQGFLAERNPTGAEPVPDSGLVYFAQNDTYLAGFNENASLPFVPGRTYRLRLINMSALAMFYVWLEGHSMTVIEADGTYVEDYLVDGPLTVSAAQRYSVLVRALPDASTNYVFHATQSQDMYDSVPDTLQLNTSAVIEYAAGAPLAPPTLLDAFPTGFNDTVLVPRVAVAMLEPTYSLNLTATFDTFSDGTPRAAFNDIVWNPPLVPSLFSMLSMGADAAEPGVYAPEQGTVVLPARTAVEVTIINGDQGLHPFHLHGHKFQIVQKNNNVTTDDPVDNPPFDADQPNPMRRDTVTVPAEGSVTIRWTTDNPGAWLLHCHIDWHFSQGLAITFIEDPLGAQRALTLPPAMLEMCADDGLPATGNAAGRDSTTDVAGVTVGPYVQTFGFKAKGIVAMTACVLTALLGVLTVGWYAFLGPTITDEEHEHEVREALARKDAKGGGLVKRSLAGLRRPVRSV